MLAAPVLLPDPKGGPPLELRPTLDVWLTLERAHGPVGQLFLDVKTGRIRLGVYLDLIWRSARAAGSELTWSDTATVVHQLGLYRATDLVLELFADLFVPPDEQDLGEQEGEGVPLASGG